MLKPTAAPPVDRSRLRMRLARTTRARLARVGRWRRGIFCAAFVVLLASALRIVGATSPTGDEPAYLLQAYGLWQYHSLDLAPALRDPSVYGQFYSFPPTGLARDFVGNGERVLVFLPGYAVLISPLFALGGRVLIAVTQALIAALVAVLLYDEAFRLFASRGVAVFAVLAYLLALPLLVFTGEAFPTTFALGLVFAGYVLVARAMPDAQGRRLLLVALALGLISFTLPWLHTKYAIIALVLPFAGLLVLLARRRLRPTRQTWYAAGLLVALPLLSFTLIALYSRHYFGSWVPPYNPNVETSYTAPDFQRVPRLFQQIFFDAQIGLIPWVPLDILAPLGLIILFRRAPRHALLLLACVLSLYAVFLSVIIAYYVNEAYAFPGRFCVESLPFLALCVAGVYATGEPAVRQAFSWLAPRLCTGKRLMGHMSPGRLARIALALACLAVLAFGGWLAGVAQLDPALLYPSHAGARLTYEFPHLLPASWFDRFPESEAPLIYSGAPVLDPYYSHGTPVAGATGTQGYLAARAAGKDGDIVGESALLSLPPGAYEATAMVTCDPVRDSQAIFEAVALRNPLIRDVPMGAQTFTGAVCQGSTTQVPLRFRFTSDGYRPIGLAVRTRSATTLVMWSVTFGPAPGSHMGGAA